MSSATKNLSSELPTSADQPTSLDSSQFEFPASVADQSASSEVTNSLAVCNHQHIVEPLVSGDGGSTPNLMKLPGTAYSRGGVSMTTASVGVASDSLNL